MKAPRAKIRTTDHYTAVLLSHKDPFVNKIWHTYGWQTWKLVY